MAEDDRRQPGGRGVQVQAEQFVEDEEVDATHLYHPGGGRSAAQSPWSLLPLTACTGAIRSSPANTLGSPMSPAWMMSSTPSRAAAPGDARTRGCRR